ncbi:YeeE/YedE thiosulfate transporter family protein [Roseicella aerolata]|uniref:YeeE/YedE family protein n=1 Tax=Roseicella aerolata TaxID=2883479 RepID=A0A9X1L979_9PROT|nr:YeeE/YedE thiosulfate transporter family protein [Roseicella aerolata]MCB4823359.1 YeeE/YedE family protein [Roseicella aerolata]
MSVLAAIAIGLAMGAVFGLALEKSRVFEPGVILGQMQLRNFLMLKIFLTAVTTGLLVLAVLNGLGLAKLHPKATLYGADLLGGLLLGIGIALAGACPGTVAAQIGAGYRDAWFTLAGGLLGATAFAYAEPVLKPLLLTGGPGRITLAHVTGLPFWPLALGFAALLVAGLVALERWRPWRAEIGPAADGLLPQAPPAGAEPLTGLRAAG